jgi:putative ABC transport system substrate-binding protein
MRRREFITFLGGMAVACPLAARAQQPERMRRIGWNAIGADDGGPERSQRLGAFKQGLAALGWVAGRNLVFEERWSNSDVTQHRKNAAELAALRPDLIFAVNSPDLAAMRRATGIIPIVFASVADPVGQGFVSSLAQPGGNITGFAGAEFAIASKILELLKRLAPNVRRVAIIYDPVNSATTGYVAESEAVAAALGVEVLKTPVHNAADIERAINDLARAPNPGLVVLPSLAASLGRDVIVSLAARHRMPSVYFSRIYVESGGLASYGWDDLDLSRRAASYADRILKGEKPANLPVQLPTRFTLVVNLKAAKDIGLTLSPDVLALADELIE